MSLWPSCFWLFRWSEPRNIRDIPTNWPGSDFERELHAIVDPEEVDQRAKSDQRKLVEAHGGREKIMGQGVLVGGTPPPGVEAVFE